MQREEVYNTPQGGVNTVRPMDLSQFYNPGATQDSTLPPELQDPSIDQPVQGRDPRVVLEGLTAGEKSGDEEFAKVANDWLSGGFSDTQKGIDQLGSALTDLTSGKVTTGGLKGVAAMVLGDSIMGLYDSDFIDTKEKVAEVTQRNLRLILGAQFAQKEGELLIARAYNPLLSTEVNRKRVASLLNQMQKAAVAKNEMVTYYRANNNSLKGYDGPSQLEMEADFSPKNLWGDDGGGLQNETMRIKNVDYIKIGDKWYVE